MAQSLTVMLCAVSVHFATAASVNRHFRFGGPNGDDNAPADATPTGNATEESCDSVSRFMVGDGTCVHNNLGGFGPDTGGEESLVFANVFPFHTERIDMRIKAADGQYEAFNVSNNGEHGYFMSINVKCGTTAVLDVDLVNGNTGEPTPAPYEWMFSIFDFDSEIGGAGTESVSIRGFDSVIKTTNSRVKEEVDGIFSKFTASRQGELQDNPTFPWNLTEFQKDDTVTLLYSPRFEMRLKLYATDCETGRNFLFSGSTGLGCDWKAKCSDMHCPRNMGKRRSEDHGDGNELFCKHETCGDVDVDSCCVSTTTTTTTNPCSNENMLTFKNVKSSNLGGLGPDTDAEKAIIFENVLPGLEEQVDLALTDMAESPYTPGNASRTGLVNDLFGFNVQMDTWTRIKFEFRKAGTKIPVEVPPFYFTISDIDQREGGGGQESVKVSKWSDITFCPHTSLVFDESESAGRITASMSGELDDNPTSAMSFSGESMQKAVTFTMPSLYNFFVTVGATARESCRWNCQDQDTGRNVFFAGASDLVCDGSEPLNLADAAESL